MNGLYRLTVEVSAQRDVNGFVVGSRLSGWLTERVADVLENLKIRPMNLGESRGTSTERTWTNYPVTVDYTVSLSDRRVRVTAVRLTGF